MDRQPAHSTFAVLPAVFWLLAMLALTALQAWISLGLFAPSSDASPEDCYRRILDQAPILSGRHPLHLYHGYLGAHFLKERGSVRGYDPHFQAGYPKSPVFDHGSRPAEASLLLAGARYRPDAYKIGVFATCCLVPWFLALAARGVGLGYVASWLAALLGLAAWWSHPCRRVLADGDWHTLLGGLSALTFLGMLIRFDRIPGVAVWLGLTFTATLTWYASPLLAIALLPLLLIYYLGTGARHAWHWHFALISCVGLAVTLNGFWLIEWVAAWWIRLPLAAHHEVPVVRDWLSLWNSPRWGNSAERAFACGLLGLAAAGIVLLNICKQRTAARLLGGSLAGLLICVAAGVSWQPLSRMGTAQLLALALFFAVIPVIYLFVTLTRCTARRSTTAFASGLAALGAVSALGFSGSDCLSDIAACMPHVAPLHIGLGDEERDLLVLLHEHTDLQARILIEDRPGHGWTALLPMLLDRHFIGGLDADMGIEHAFASLDAERFLGRPMREWSDAELNDHARRYNLGWVVCWSPEVRRRMESWKTADRVAELTDGGVLYRLRRPFSYVLKGQARVVDMNHDHIALADVVPEDGKIVLSLHYQAGFAATPCRVQIEREPDPYDPIPLLRLRVPGPAARVTLSWEGR